MYLVINKTNNTIIHKNPHPVDELQPNEVYANYDSNLHTILFTEFYNESIFKIENGQLVNRTLKERIEYLIEHGEFKIANTDKVDEDGQIVPKTNKEKYNDGIITESQYRDILYTEVKNKIYQKFNEEIEYGFVYANLQFQANEESTNRVTKAVSLVDKGYLLTNEYQLPTWVSNSKDVNGNDIRYTFTDYSDLLGFSMQMGVFWQECFFKAKNLCDGKLQLTIQELENYDIEQRWNE